MTTLLPSHGATAQDRRPYAPRPRGPLSEFLFNHLHGPVHTMPAGPPVLCVDPLADDDLQLALYGCYELHYRGFAGVDERWEWEPSLLAFRRRLEAVFQPAVAALVRAGGPAPGGDGGDGDGFAARLWAVVDAGAGGASLSAYCAERATLEQVRELAIHRSAYQLKEADPHTWVIPRLSGPAKAALVDIQADEYGGGDAAAMHAQLFADTMEALDLDPSYGTYLDRLPGITLATVNLISLFGLHRRWRAALVGHLAVFEMTSTGPMSRYAACLRRLGVGAGGRRFYEVHVVADEHHQEVAAHDMAGRLALDEPDLVEGMLFGARAVLAVEARFADHVLGAWAGGRSSLLP